MKRSRLLAGTGLCLAGGLLLAGASAMGAETDPVLQGFQAPPNSAKPWVWWHWVDNQVTKDGIGKDLAWMHRIGIGGVDQVVVSQDMPKVVDNPPGWMTPEWKDALKYAVETSKGYGFEFVINSSAGWSETGAPWVKPEQAMKKAVWTETVVDGGKRFQGKLPPLPTTSVRVGGPSSPPLTLQKDSVVLAYRLPATPEAALEIPTVTASAGTIDGALLSDGDLRKSVSVPIGADDKAWIQFAFSRPQTVRSAVFAGAGASTFLGAEPTDLEAQAADGSWRKVTTFTPAGRGPSIRISFAPVTTKALRLSFHQKAGGPLINPIPGMDLSNPTVAALTGTSPRAVSVSEMAFSSRAFVNEPERKAAFSMADDYYALDTADALSSQAVPLGDVIDISSKMAPDGTLDWTAPAGRWMVLRMGYTLTGATIHPVTPEAAGLEVDKLNKTYVRDYIETYLKAHEDVLGPTLMGKAGVRSLLIDSIETGSQNWSDDILADFKRLRGYDARPWLPTLTGTIVQSAAASDKFLWDFRRTIGELFATAHYQTVAEVGRAHGLTVYGESLESSRGLPGDDGEHRRFNDYPMGSVAASYPFKPTADTGVADARGAASTAHLYGQNIAGAETFTSCANAPWTFAPRDLKPTADSTFAYGINRIFIHSSVHQPVDQVPGLTLGICGIYFNRLDTWAEQATPWISYLTRSAYLLQQGRYFADVAYFHGEEAPLITLKSRGKLKDVPHANAYDLVSPHALIDLLQYRDGALMTPTGMRYRVLQLGGASERMSVPVLRKIRQLVQAGAVVVGKAPTDTPSKSDNQAEFKRLKAELWGANGQGAALGRGRVYGNSDVDTVLAKEGVGTDFAFQNVPDWKENVLFLHRTLPDREIYFVFNQSDAPITAPATFRVTGKAPEQWNAETGQIRPLSFTAANGRTTIPMKLGARDSAFIVFHKPTSETSRTIAEPVVTDLGEIAGGWNVRFQPGRGAPASVAMDRLQSWSDFADPGIKYFSGTATYSKEIDVPASSLGAGRKLVLDLGQTEVIAEVTVNGKVVGSAWHAPYTVDVTSGLRPGKNQIEIKVSNLWVNRLIGDQQPGATKITQQRTPTYVANAPLRPSGLIGPVRLRGEDTPPAR